VSETLRVRILDLSGGAEEGITEEVRGFDGVEAAIRFARAYVRDSLEHCRQPGMDARGLLDAWLTFGEDAVVLDPTGPAWESRAELQTLASHPASPPDRDWRALDPRRRIP